MNHSTIVATKYIDNKLTVVAECYQHDNGKNEWFKLNDIQTWQDWSEDWLAYLDGDIVKYGKQMFRAISRMRIEPLHTCPTKPLFDSCAVDWSKVGEIIRSHFRT
jgi:hypothetical protein